ncbi:amino acid aminotransferase [Frigidibacter sp. MR17.14]|uniref:amino acid aminotransferase n=1 Tax=Frigidibacter sp. MR17.14 TaxID=3126509 RepID=UPI003012D083
MFDRLTEQPADALLAIIGLYRADPRPEKIDLGVGVFRDSTGRTPVMAAVKAAETRLLATQDSKSYLGPEGDRDFAALTAELALGPALAADPRLVALQTPGGGGALRLAAELAVAANPEGRIWMGTPTWPNHGDIFRVARLKVETYRAHDIDRQCLLFDEMTAAFNRAERGDLVLIHGCCHNPTGIDLDPAQWAELTRIVVARGLVPLIDFAYQGLGDGLEDDAGGLRGMLAAVPEAMVAYSCDKNFALYRDRVGALFVQAADAREAGLARATALSLARVNWSMPPDHGAAAVRVVLQDTELQAQWREELREMQARLRTIRQGLAANTPAFAPLATGNGLFATLPLSGNQVAALRRDHAVYVVGSGRCNLAGLNQQNLSRFAEALADVGCGSVPASATGEAAQ